MNQNEMNRLVSNVQSNNERANQQYSTDDLTITADISLRDLCMLHEFIGSMYTVMNSETMTNEDKAYVMEDLDNVRDFLKDLKIREVRLKYN